MLFGSLKGINDGEEDVEVPNVVLELVVEGLGSLKGIRELLLLLTVELTVGLLELLELLKVGVTVELFLYGVMVDISTLPVKFSTINNALHFMEKSNGVEMRPSIVHIRVMTFITRNYNQCKTKCFSFF